MRDIPALLSGYTLMVTGEPEGKVRELKDGSVEPAMDKSGEVQAFTVLVLAKQKTEPGQPRRKDGEELKVNLPNGDPGHGFEVGTFVELVNPVLNTYEMRNEENRITGAGIWWKADGLKPAASGVKAPKRSGSEAKSAGADSGEAVA